MNGRAVLVGLLLVAVLGLALPAVAQDGPTAGNESVQSDNATVDNVTVGQSISGFMQSTAAGTESDVDQGIYQAQYETANESDRPALVENRTERLEGRLAAVEERIDRIRDQRGELNPTAYRAQMSAAAAQLRALETSANETERDAVATGVNATRLERLRTDASELGGGEVAEIARNLSGVPADVPGQRGPPDHAGPGNRGPPNGTDGNPGNGPGPPDDRGNGTDGAGTGGQGNGPGGQGADTGQGNGPGGQGADTGQGNGSGEQGAGTGGQGTGTGQGTDTGGQGTGTGTGAGDAGTGSVGLFWTPFGA